MSLAKKEFLWVKEVIESEEIEVKLVTHFADKTVVGYAIYDTNTQIKHKIQIQKSKSMTYAEILLNLLHEYAHVIDRKRYGKGKRWKSRDYWDNYDTNVSAALDIPVYAKKSILKTEFLAKEISKKLRKKFNLQSLNDATIEGNELLNLLTRRYELLYGKTPNDRLKNFWKDGIITGRIHMSLQDILDLDGDFECLCMT